MFFVEKKEKASATVWDQQFVFLTTIGLYGIKEKD